MGKTLVPRRFGLLVGAAGWALCAAAPAWSQQVPPPAGPVPGETPQQAADRETAAQQAAAADGGDRPGGNAVVQQERDEGGLADIVVTATKRGQAQNVQNVAIAVTAFGAAQLEEQHFQNLQSLSYSMPNVQLTQIGVQPGYATFSIRGFGISSSIPSIDPTVGTFIDGVYMGVNTGVVLNNFDIEGIEVLRGPQGLLFGRNVTGGAVVIRSTVPTNNFHADVRAAVSSGPQARLSGVVTGPIVKDKIQAKLAVLYDKDFGYFTNEFNNRDDLGRNTTFIIRPAVRLTPIDGFETILRYEHGRFDGDGAVASNRGLFPADSFRTSLDYEGFSRNRWNSASSEVNIDTDFGDGKITNLLAYRGVTARSGADIDASPRYDYHVNYLTRQRQMSEELRYAGTFGRVDVTTGLYYFNQNIRYIEDRFLRAGTTHITGGGEQRQDTYGVFASFDWHFLDTLTLNAGARYSSETKRVRVANLVPGGCDYAAQQCNYTFRGENTWRNFAPRVGLQWRPTDRTQVYGFWARGFRSGGYNFRNVFTQIDPGPFDDEKLNSYEIGLKQDIGNYLRFNGALFWNDIGDLQREIQTAVPGVGTAQRILNSANARVRGAEGEMTVRPGAGFTLAGQFGYLDGQYTDVFFDLNNDRVVDGRDRALQLPRLAPWTYGGSIAWTRDFDRMGVDARVAANHRDADFYNDANTGILPGATMVDANLTLRHGPYSLSFFGLNLLDRVTLGANVPLTFFPGSTFSSLNKGRVYGVELAAKF